MEKVNESLTKIDLKDIPDSIQGVSISNADKLKLSTTGKSNLMEDVYFESERVTKDIYIKALQKNGKTEFLIENSQKPLIIPDVIANRKLSAEDKKALSEKKVVGAFKYKGIEFALQIDAKNSSVTISRDKQIAVPTSLGGYKFSANEMKRLDLGEKIATKLYKGDYGYFMANLSITKDKKGFVFENIKSIQSPKIEEFLKKFNNVEIDKQENVIENVISSSEPDKQKEKEISNVKEKEESYNKEINKDDSYKKKEKEFFEALQNKDYNKIDKIVKQGFIPTEKTLTTIKNNSELSLDDKVAVATILKKDVKELSKIETGYDIEHEITNNKNKSRDPYRKMHKMHTVKEFAHNAFNNM